MTGKHKIAASCGVTPRAGGLYYAVGALYRTMCRDGWSVSVFGEDASFTDEDRTFWNPVKVELYKAFGPLRSSFALSSMLDRCEADLGHQHGLWLADQNVVSGWGRRENKPVVISPHGMLDPWALAHSGWKKRLVGAWYANKSLKQATCLHALCQSELESIRAYGLSNPVAVIPNGVDLPDRIEKPVKDGCRKNMLFMGRLHPKKGVAELIQAWKMRSREWRLVIAGWDDGGHQQELLKLAGNDPSIEFVGAKFGPEKDVLLRSADAYVLPSFSEGLPMTVLEAWSYGLPVVMTPFCNIPEGFSEKAALEIQPDVESIAGGLDLVESWQDRELRKMGENGRKLVEQKFTWAKVAEQMSKVYEWCLAGDNPPSSMEF